MRCAFFWMAAPFLLGIVSQDLFPAKVSCYLIFFLLPALGFSRGRRIFLLFLCLIWLFLGNLYSHVDRFRPAGAIENFLSDSAWLKGTVAGLPEVKVKGKRRTVSFVLEAEETGWKPVEGKVQVFLINPRVVPEAGNQIILKGKLEAPRSFGPNFDYARFLKSQGIYASFQGIGWKSVTICGKKDTPWILKAQKKTGEIISRFASGQNAVIFKALILGTRAGLDPELKNAFFRSGTSQVFAMPNRGILESSVASNFVINASS